MERRHAGAKQDSADAAERGEERRLREEPISRTTGAPSLRRALALRRCGSSMSVSAMSSVSANPPPAYSNDSGENRARNRRVVITVDDL